MLVTKQAPNFIAEAVKADGMFDDKFELYNNIGKNGAVLFFWPKDFTFVCPSEIIAFDNRVKEFQDRGINLIGVSIDSKEVHFAWRNTEVKNGGIGPVNFPIVSDITKSISRDYDVLFGGAVALRGTFLIDRNKIIRHATINDLPLGRNVDETLRMVDALLFFEEHGEVCPAGWNKGDKGMRADAKGVAEYLAQNASKL
ncbi:peroxiredoxin [Helicobacter sp. MIT 99-5507]|uniref:peroxiredoxin n=1 Tax=Helicobacter sp. MIT 99-5507 TaxID=152489 RepID=UPI000E1EA995|nr:peroxiredoxin [Helicobacter sp. MIT 99-5507]RDU57551.1 peroxidase [Helicobacter sp. MIT 99-5507]